jgi:midasin (ATPase involved in ribosome maturation)
MNIATFIETVPGLPADISIMVRGPHGVGKSQIFKQIADKLGLELIDRRLSQMTEGDLLGLPELADGVTRFCPPDWYMAACKAPKVLLLDEYNRGTPEVIQTAMQITLDRELNGWKLHPETRIYAAINASADYNVNELDFAQADRFWTIDLEPTVEDWLNWAKGALVDDVIIDFIRQQPKHLRHNGQCEPGKVYPSQRSWDRLDQSLKHAKLAPSQIAGTDQKGLYFISVGFVGFEAASALADFVKNYESQISAEDVVDGWKKNKDKILKLSADKQNAVLEKVLDYCGKVTLTDKQSDNIAAMLKELSGEMMVSFVNKLMALNRVDNLRAIHSRVRDTLMLQVTSAAKKK